MRASSVKAADAVLKLTIGHRVLVPLISKMRVKIMKKLFYLGGILAAMLSLTNCAKEIDAPEVNEGYKVELSANSAVSKTWNEDLKTVWGSRDALTVFYAEAGTEHYGPNLKFSIVDTLEGRFECVLPAPLTKEVYDWYAQYPYTSQVTSPANTNSGYVTIGSKSTECQLQTKANSMSHIAGNNYPLFGKVTGVPVKETPNVVMSHATSLLEIVVTNNSASTVKVSELAFTAPEDIVGRFYINFAGDDLVYTPYGSGAYNTAKLAVDPAVEIATGESSKFYMAIKPFTAPVESNLALSLNAGTAKEVTLTEAKTFEAGVINTLNYTVSADDVVAEKQEIVATVAEFIAAADGFNTYILTGKITSVANTTYGNFYLADETGEVYIYGLCSPEGEVKYWAESGVKLGDIITVKGSYTLYGTTHEIVNAIYVSHESVDEEPEAAFTEGDYWLVANAHYAMPLTGNYGYLQVGDAGYKDNVFTFTAVEGGFTIQQPDGKYLYMKGNYDSYNVSATIPSEGHIWSVEENAEGALVITNVLKNKIVQYDPTYNSYGAYSDVRGVFPELVDASSATERPEVTDVPSISCKDNVVTITAEEGAKIYYTTNGDEPTAASTLYTEAFEITETITIKAIAVVEGKLNSDVVTKSCTWVDPNAGSDGEQGSGVPATAACYTLSTASATGSNNSYAGNCDITIDQVTWNFTGNSQMNPWRMGGKSITDQDRAIYSKTAYAASLSKVEFVSGSVNATWNSMKLEYSTNSDFTDAVTLHAEAVGENKTIAFAPEGGFPANCYFRFVLNITVLSETSNKYVQLKEIKFYGWE